jgi:hypothetical protein
MRLNGSEEKDPDRTAHVKHAAMHRVLLVDRPSLDLDRLVVASQINEDVRQAKGSSTGPARR